MDEEDITHSRLPLLRTLSLQNAPELQEYVLQDITPGEHVGEGAYGNVTKLDYKGTLCAGKALHRILLHAEEGNLREKFVHECRLLKNLRHPHIVQFLGICFLSGSDLPALVMEFLPYNLHDMLTEHHRIHMSVKLSILQDVTRGLCYLHSQAPPIVHRDLSARNVLLNSALTAKIADFGVARIIDPHHLSRTLTSIPGAGVYMPPEAVQSEDALMYSNMLDVFSFGVLVLFVVTQVFPKDPLPATYTDQHDELRPRTELQRRQAYVTTAEQILGGNHPLLDIVRECLSNVVDRRPTAVAILERIKELNTGGEREDDLMAMDMLHMMEQLQRVQEECELLQGILYDEDTLGVRLTEKERQITELEEERRHLNQELSAVERRLRSTQASMRVKEQEKTNLENQLSRQQAELHRRETDITNLRERQERDLTLQAELSAAQEQAEELHREKFELEQRLTEEIETKERRLQEKEDQVVVAKREVDRMNGELSEKRRVTDSLRTRLNATEAQLQEKEAQLVELERLGEVEQQLADIQETDAALRLENAQMRNIASMKPPPQPVGLQVNFPLTFALAHSTPFGVNSSRAVQLGASVVVAGGNADVDNQEQVMFYRPATEKGWGVLGKYSLSLFAMAVLGGGKLLVLIGGYDRAMDTYSSDLVQWDRSGKYWRPIFVPMPTARSDAAAVGYKGYLVVAGGSNGVQNLTTVEILDTHNVQWSTVAPLPAPIEGLIQSVPLTDPSRPEADTWYIMGWETGLRQPAHIFSLSLDQLTAQMREEGAVSWAQLPTPPLACCGAVSFRGCLLAVGGKDRHGTKKKDIYLYLPGTCEWLRVAELPVAKHSCCCYALSTQEFLVIGGTEATQFSSRVDIARS